MSGTRQNTNETLNNDRNVQNHMSGTRQNTNETLNIT